MFTELQMRKYVILCIPGGMLSSFQEIINEAISKSIDHPELSKLPSKFFKYPWRLRDEH